jgi:hypothetical protein
VLEQAHGAAEHVRAQLAPVRAARAAAREGQRPVRGGAEAVEVVEAQALGEGDALQDRGVAVDLVGR